MTVLNAALLFILFAGHCELMAAWINRFHAIAFPRPILKGSRLLHDLLLLAYWPVVLWQVGLGGPRLLVDGEWSLVPAGWKLYFGFCCLGVFSLLIAIVRQLTATWPELRAAKRVDVPRETSKACIGPGWRGRLARLPGNQALQLEINEKEFQLPALPEELDGLTIAHVSDVHFRGPISVDYFRYGFERVAAMGADLVIFSGDLLDEQECLDWLPETFGQLSAPLGCWYILGNHDSLLDTKEMRRALTELGWNDIGSRVVTLEYKSQRIAIGGDERPWLGSAPDFDTADQANLRILVSHTPDNIRDAVRQRVDLMLSGHNHGGQVRLPLIGPVYSPSLYGVKYASGSFRVGKTVLHVSRGMSAERPLRWNCPPEITKIVLRADRSAKNLSE